MRRVRRGLGLQPPHRARQRAPGARPDIAVLAHLPRQQGFGPPRRERIGSRQHQQRGQQAQGIARRLLAERAGDVSPPAGNALGQAHAGQLPPGAEQRLIGAARTPGIGNHPDLGEATEAGVFQLPSQVIAIVELQDRLTRHRRRLGLLPPGPVGLEPGDQRPQLGRAGRWHVQLETGAGIDLVADLPRIFRRGDLQCREQKADGDGRRAHASL